MSDDDAAGVRGEEISAADEQALRSMFAALVQDAEPSELSALQVQRHARAEQREVRDRRSKRIAYTRNTLIAAVVIGVMALVAPRLLTSSGSTAASASSSAAGIPGADATSAAAAATSAAASHPAAPAPAGAAAAGDGSSAAASGAASSGSAAAGSAPAESAGGGSSAAGSSASSASAASSGGASSASAPASSAAASSTAPGACLPVPPRALADVRAALPGYRGTIRIASCSIQTSTQSASGTAIFAVSRTGPASCGAAASPCPTPTGSRVPDTRDAYSVSGGVVVAGPRGLTVTATATAGGPNRQALIAGARALLKSLG